ncbi:MAG: hypothetical protein ACR2JJ_02710 [Sphingomicrobium sp.]
MASRMFWIFLVAVALVAGTLFQGRNFIFGAAGDAAVEARVEQAIEGRVGRAVESSFERVHVVGSDGRTIDVAPQTKRELGNAVRRLAAAEAELAITRDSGDAAARDARSRRDAARADVERLKAEIERQDERSAADRDLVRQQIQHEVRSSVRETVRSAVRG